jgi:hypothetical protein
VNPSDHGRADAEAKLTADAEAKAKATRQAEYIAAYDTRIAEAAPEPTPEPEQPAPSPVDTRAIAREIQGGPPADPKASAMRDIAKEIRGY